MTPPAIDRTTGLDINGSIQHVRACAARAGLPPLLIVQGGPGLPLLHEVPKFQRLLHLEEDFLVAYWEQRGCGDASRRDADSVSLPRQVDDLRAVLRWLHGATGQRVTMLGISLGGTFVLQAAGYESDLAKAAIVISPDSQTTRSDASAHAFLQEQGFRAGGRRLSRRVKSLEPPPYVNPGAFLRRASLLADLGAIEHGKTFGALSREMLFAMVGAYGVMGTVRAVRNSNLVQRKLLPEVVSLDLLGNPPRVAIPVHYVFGGRDALTPASIAEELPAAIGAPASTVVRVPAAGHHVHFDHPDLVRSIVASA